MTLRRLILALVLTLTARAGEPATALTLSGQAVDPLNAPQAKAIVLVFVATDCPIANRAIPTLNQLAQDFTPQQIIFWAVYADADVTPAAIAAHQKEFQFTLPVLLDPPHALVKTTQAEVTPEVAVYLPAAQKNQPGAWVYRGRIDDQYQDFGRARPAATQHDLRDVLTAITAGQPPAPRTTKAVGCYISR